MPEHETFHHRAVELDERLTEAAPGLAGHRLGEVLRHDDDRAADLVGAVPELRVERDRQVRRDGPGRGRPDEHRHLFPGQRRQARRQLGSAGFAQRELDVDRGRGVRLVLHLGFGQRGPAVRAPVDGLLALVDHVLLDEPAQGADDRRLVTERHGLVGVVPQPDDAQALEAPALDVHVLLGVGAAGAAEVCRAHLPLLRPELAIDFQFDGQAVAVPARQVGGIEPQHVVGLDDQILQDLVERRADVDVAVGVRRPVVQKEELGPFPRVANLAVEVHRVPAGDGLRLGCLEIGLHREGRARQITGVLPLSHGDLTIVM